MATEVWVVLLLFCVVSLSLPLLENTAACKAIDNCDPFQPICATYGNEHQFFYSHCDMMREICLTGKNWKYDFFSHCNVSKL
ncbi:follistatin-related protein 1 [Drosophila willistoni]|uniref:follistatin-related protein 1 n=1 Tax=Drosophila willistoni TaxID=7260 RepID=UPI000C26D048|nr:follistatin-related protein 1 [Drosophila willistoni]